jgi:putative FmdB family regulatory protein
MPIYEYACEKCGKLNEVLQKVNDPAPAVCDGCNTAGPLVKIVSRTSFVLKGGGWYSDLYGSTKKGGGSGAKGSEGSGKTESTSSSTGAASSSTTAPSSSTSTTPSTPAKSSDSKS